MSVPQPIEFEERNLYCPGCNEQLPEKVRQDGEEITCAKCGWSTKDEDKIPYFMVFAPMQVLECEDVLSWLDREREFQLAMGGVSEFLEMFYANVVEALQKADAINEAASRARGDIG